MASEQVIEPGKSGFDIALAFLDWPFLLFAFLVVFVFFFKDKVMGLLERGDIQISWGENRHIKLKELSDGIDQEIDPIKEEIQELREQIEKLSSTSVKGVELMHSSHSLSDDQRKVAESRIIEGLKNHRYRWRSIERLAAISGISESDALDILRSNTDVVLSIGKSKQQIAKLRDR